MNRNAGAADRMEAALTARLARYRHLAIALRYDYPETTAPASAIEALLVEAYRDGARDMYALIDDELAPLWKAVGFDE